ncbi:Mss4-like protein [Hyaloraphidium curvatum]|nr:Mss4-like protein [Hyaloraphidium curvatum]
MAQHQGDCFCGSVKLRVTGEPSAMGFCHCRSCRHWAGGPLNMFTIWPATGLEITAGADLIGTFRSNPDSFSARKFCTKCGGHLYNDHGAVVDVFASTIPSLEFKAGMHVHYQETVMPEGTFKGDGLPKFKDFPKDFGGSGDLMDL